MTLTSVWAAVREGNNYAFGQPQFVLGLFDWEEGAQEEVRRAEASNTYLNVRYRVKVFQIQSKPETR